MVDRPNLRVRFWLAVELFTVSKEPLPQRLYLAFTSHLLKLRLDDFPEPARSEWQAIRRELTVVPDEQVGSAAATARQMSPEKAKELIERIVALAREFQRWGRR